MPVGIKYKKWNGTNWSTLSPSETSLGTGAPAAGATGAATGGHRGGFMGGCAPSDYIYFIGRTSYSPSCIFTDYDIAGETVVRCPDLLYGHPQDFLVIFVLVLYQVV